MMIHVWFFWTKIPFSFSWFLSVCSQRSTPVSAHLLFIYSVEHFLFSDFFQSFLSQLFELYVSLLQPSPLVCTCSIFETQLTGDNQHLLPHSELNYLKFYNLFHCWGHVSCYSSWCISSLSSLRSAKTLFLTALHIQTCKLQGDSITFSMCSAVNNIHFLDF